jgi:hypothetical protein
MPLRAAPLRAVPLRAVPQLEASCERTPFCVQDAAPDFSVFGGADGGGCMSDEAEDNIDDEDDFVIID